MKNILLILCTAIIHHPFCQSDIMKVECPHVYCGDHHPHEHVDYKHIITNSTPFVDYQNKGRVGRIDLPLGNTQKLLYPVYRIVSSMAETTEKISKIDYINLLGRTYRIDIFTENDKEGKKEIHANYVPVDSSGLSFHTINYVEINFGSHIAKVHSFILLNYENHSINDLYTESVELSVDPTTCKETSDAVILFVNGSIEVCLGADVSVEKTTDKFLILIYDTNGRLIHSENIFRTTGEVIRMDIPKHVSDGLYFLSISNSSETCSSTKKIVVNSSF